MVNFPMSHSVRAQQTSEMGSVAYTLAVIALTVLLIGLGIAFGLTSWIDSETERRADPALTATHLITIGAQHYIVPAALITQPAQRRDGFSERVDLTLALPLGVNGRLTELELAIMPRGRARTSANLLDSVYLHQFANEQTQGVPGLVGKPLQGDAGTLGETVWYDPLNAAPFVAKCMAPIEGEAESRTCLRIVQLSDRNTAILTFEPSVLQNWRQFDMVVENWLASLRK